jgi:hypothetical protein
MFKCIRAKGPAWNAILQCDRSITECKIGSRKYRQVIRFCGHIFECEFSISRSSSALYNAFAEQEQPETKLYSSRKWNHIDGLCGHSFECEFAAARASTALSNAFAQKQQHETPLYSATVVFRNAQWFLKNTGWFSLSVGMSLNAKIHTYDSRISCQ